MAGEKKSLKAAKAEKAAKRRKARRRKRAVFMIAEWMILFLLLGIGYMMVKYGKIQLHSFEEGDIQVNDGVKQEGYTTIALFGGDSREGQLEAGTHSDTIIVASIDNKTKKVRLASVYRDTLVEEADGELKKANNAYFQGGPQEAINMLNRNFDLDIEHYVMVDFKALADTIDLLGGIEVDVSSEEAVEVNKYIGETAMVAGKSVNRIEGGVQVLDGVQATTYARIRKNVGEDYARTQRQRVVLQEVAKKAKQADLATVNSIIDTVFPQISTSFTLGEALRMASGMKQYELAETTGYPFEYKDGIEIKGAGDIVLPLGAAENVQELHAFLYPDDAYTVSQTVLEIADRMKEVSGYGREDFENARNPENPENAE